MTERLTGKVKFFNEEKGYGFITPNGNHQDVFVHISAIRDAHYDGLNENDVIEFDVVEGRNGKTQAENIKILN